MSAVPSLAVQIVLYENDLDSISRVVDGVAASVAQAIQFGAIRTAEILLGDSTSVALLDDPTVEQLRTNAMQAGIAGLRYVFFGDNLGSGGGSNRLAEESDSDLVLVLNPDTYPKPDVIVELVRAVAPDDVAAADARQIPIEHPKAYDPLDHSCSWVSGACMLVKRAAFDAVDGFDADNFPMYCDDVDLSWRLRHAGYRVVHQPSAVVFHAKSLAIGGHVQPAPTEKYWTALARLLLVTKWGREDLKNVTTVLIKDRAEADELRALNDFRSRAKAGTLPQPIEEAARTAVFIGTEYAEHRWA